MAIKKLYGSDEFDLLTEFTGDERILVNQNNVIKRVNIELFRGDKGDKGDSGDVVLPDGLVVTSLGYNLLADESQEEMRDTLGLGDAATYNIGTADNELVLGNDTRLFPVGGIIMWSGYTSTLPPSWRLCNGSFGTPDLRDKFILGAGGSYSVHTVGGSKDAVVVAHTHTGTTEPAGHHTHTSTFPSGINMNNSGNDTDDRNWSSTKGEVQRQTSSVNDHTHSLTINSSGQSGVNANIPPYYCLAFIMYVGD